MLQQNSNAGKLQLNAADLACARQLLEANKESKDPGPMYDFLASKGDRYAILANGVVRGDSIAGAMAIHYLESVAASHNQPITEMRLKHIRYDMAHGYLNTQQKRLDDSPTGIIYGDIDHKQAGQFHNEELKRHGLPSKAWTLDPVFRAIDERSQPIYWQWVLNAAGKPKEELRLSADTYQKMALSAKVAPDGIRQSSREWFDRVDSLPGYWALAKSSTSQLFAFDQTTTVLPQQCNFDINISPTPQPVQRIADEDQARRDVTNGYLVNKPTHSFSFTDGSLDKTDFTSVQMGGMASGGIRPGEVQLDPNVQPSRYLSDYYLERPSYILPETGLFDAATLNSLSAQTTVNTYVDPLLLDLTGKGVSMTGIEDGVLFDTDNSGSLKRTGWAAPDTGMLVLDNGSGKIDNISQMYSEYYGGTAGVNGQPGEKRYTNGFAALASEDADGNGAIDKHDPVWGKLRIWQDASHNGKVDPGELKTLDEWRITQIKVKANAIEDDNRNGNRVMARGVFSIRGRKHEVLAVNFASSPVSNRILKQDADGALIHSATGETTTTAYVELTNSGDVLFADELKVNNIYGGHGDDRLSASASGSWLVGRGGSNTYIGNTGDDVFVISASDDTNNIKGNGGRDTVLIAGKKGVALNMARSGITIAQGGDGDDIIVSGGNNSVFIKGGKGNATLVGGGANDVLAGGSGKNLIIGGSGKAVIYAGSQGDTLYASEQGSIIYAGGGADRIYGNEGHDVIEAGHGDAQIDGGGGINLVALHGSYADYTITRTDSGFQIRDKVAGRDGTLALKNIQKLNFADISAVDLNTNNIIPVDDVLSLSQPGRTFHRRWAQRIPAASLLANDLQFNGETPGYLSAVGDAVGGTVKLNLQKDVVFTPGSTFTGVMSFKYEVKSSSGDPAISVVDLSSGESAGMRGTVTLLTPDIPHDPFVAKQTYLNDINVIPVWQDYTGKGIRMGQFEPGGPFATGPEIFDIQHPDLAANVDPIWLATQNSAGTLATDVSNHATMVAGVMAATRNGVGGVGVAYDATLGGHYLSNNGADMTTLGKMSSYDVVNHSWSSQPDFALSHTAGGALNLPNLLNTTLHYAAANGRGGLGTVIVTAGGNQREQGGSTQGSLMSHSRFAIQVGAISTPTDLSTLQTRSPPFSNPGASLLVSAPGNRVLSSGHQIKAERGAVFGSEYSTEQGTSFAAPMVSGIAALMLQANPNLGYRDVQQILALSARKVNDPATQWRINNAKNWNGGGMQISHDYGFGMVDARAAVRLAESWMSKNTDANQQSLEKSHYYATWKRLYAGGVDTSSMTMTSGLNVEQVEVDVSAAVGRLGDLTVKLISPSGSESILLDRAGKKPAVNDTDMGSALSGEFNYTFMSTHYRGEDSTGQWKLVVKDAKEGLPIKLNRWSLRLFGHKTGADDVYFYTDEFAAQVAEQPTRAILNDAINGVAGGRNTLNAAAMSGAVKINLVTGEANLGGTTLTINSPQTIHNIVSGDGNDVLTAGRNNSLLDGGRGRNTLEGGAGKEIFVVRKRPQGHDRIINFEADKREVINLVGFAEKGFSELRLQQRWGDVQIKLADGQIITIGGQQVAALQAHHFNFQDTFTAPVHYVDSSKSMDNPARKATDILLNGGAGGITLRTNAQGKMVASLLGTVYQRDNAEPSTFVVIQQEGQSDYRNTVRGFRHGIDKIDLSAVGIRNFTELSVTKRRAMVINGLALIQGVDIEFGSEGKSISLMYLDGLDIEQLDAQDFILADTEPMLADTCFIYDDIVPLIDATFYFDNPERGSETIHLPHQVSPFSSDGLIVNRY
ncbi:S8 family serine peptidase [Yersinia enterocolitica]|uniref:S8 family serine peptidase n=1 Tax=Yersinia enterocolitica TaxID=630 RepID=UPI000C9DBFC7|nr:S8 family serine peptidase [Yersinia enterocolitica]PNM19254.1 serine protease [Yersinia enterocolitica]